MSGPDLRKYVGVCTFCRHWQIDIRPGALSDVGGATSAAMTMVEALHDHQRGDCPGAGGGRMLIGGVWVDPPKMSDGTPATGAMEMQPLPRWWVAR